MFYISDNKDEFLNLPKILYTNDPFYTTKVEDIPQDAKLFVVKENDGTKTAENVNIVNTIISKRVSFFDFILTWCFKRNWI